MSDLCDEHQLQPSVLYDWFSKAIEHLDVALDAATPRRAINRLERERDAKITALESKLAKKDQVIAKLSEEYVTLKRELQEPRPRSA